MPSIWMSAPGASRGSPLVRHAVRTDAPGDLLTLGGERPGVGLALDATCAAVGEQPQALQAPQQLRDLPRVPDPGVVGDRAVARPRMIRDPFQHPRGTVGQT